MSSGQSLEILCQTTVVSNLVTQLPASCFLTEASDMLEGLILVEAVSSHPTKAQIEILSTDDLRDNKPLFEVKRWIAGFYSPHLVTTFHCLMLITTYERGVVVVSGG